MAFLTNEEALKYVAGSGAVIQYFGCWPSFHDGEVIELSLRRPGVCMIYVHAIAGDPTILTKYTYKHGIVVFFLRGVSDMLLTNYSAQNVISAITIEPVQSRLRMEIYDSTGTQGWLEATSIEVELMELSTN